MSVQSETVDYSVPPQELEVRIARRTLGRVYLHGHGIEVGAGTRPWPLPTGTECFYGDVIDEKDLEIYFKATGSRYQGFVDAQTYAGIADEAFDFSLSAHVLEHLVDPIGSIKNALRIVKPLGLVMFALPDMRFTFDHPRPVTSLQHLISDYQTGGEDTRVDGCREHIAYLHPQWATPIPDERHEIEAIKLAEAKFDTHYHTWTTDSLKEMMQWIEENFSAEVIHTELVVNENLVVLRKR